VQYPRHWSARYPEPPADAEPGAGMHLLLTSGPADGRAGPYHQRNGATLHRSTASGTAAFTILTITAGTVTLNRLSFTTATALSQ